jgi:hypothetical protein
MSGEINVFARSQRIYVDPVSSAVSVVNAGPPGGPIGPTGPAGEVTTAAMNAAIAAALPTSAAQTYLNNLKAAKVATLENTSSTSYVDLATVGPTVTAVTGTSALLFINAEILFGNANSYWSYVAVAVSGATTIAAADANSLIYHNPYASTQAGNLSGVVLITGLTAGSNVFTLKYKHNSAVSGSFAKRVLAVIPIL